MPDQGNYKPGLGWKIAGYGPAVWDHTSGIRIHTYGICRFPDGRHVIGVNWPESREYYRHVKINGGNRRRGTMSWARSLLNNDERTRTNSVETARKGYPSRRHQYVKQTGS
jgi:hypothetical protein